MSWIKDLVEPEMRTWEDFYRNRYSHDKTVRSTHGVNCTGGCSWEVFVKNGIITWEMQAIDYPLLSPLIPDYEPRGCQRGICFSWYVYSPVRVKYPYVRGRLLDMWRKARSEGNDPAAAWASIVENPESRRNYTELRGRGGFRRASWDEALEIIAASMLNTAKKYGPDRVIGFSPIPAMSMLSYAAGSRLLALFGATILSFYDWYADFPPASPEVWGEKTDVSESADWFNSKYIVTMGSNLNMTRTPDVHFAVEARYHGAKLVVLSPDFSQVSKYADWWIPINAGMDGAFWMSVCHVILKEWYVDREANPFAEYLARYSDAPFLVELSPIAEGHKPGRLFRAQELKRYEEVEHGQWKFVVMDRLSGECRMPHGSIGHRWQQKNGQWNLEMKDGVDDSPIEPVLSLLGEHDGTTAVIFHDFAGSGTFARHVPVKQIETDRGRVAVTTVFDLLMAQFGIDRGLEGDYPLSFEDEARAYTPAWQEKFTGVGRETLVRFAREWASTAEMTGGRCMIIPGSGANHWYHANLNYRAAITALILCGCVGVNGGGLNHYTGQEKVGPETSWNTLAMALDWGTIPRLQNAPSFHYVHSDQWRYEKSYPDYHPPSGPFDAPHAIDLQVDAVRRGWMPFNPQFNESPIALVEEAEADGAREPHDIGDWAVDRLAKGKLKFAVEDPDAPENWPRVWLIWRGNALLASAKGHEYFLKHYLGAHGTAIAEETARGVPRQVKWREPVPEGKLDLVVDMNFRLDTSALYSDIVLPAASWYEKNDLNTTDLHSYIHPLGEAVPPCWQSKPDWDIFRELAQKLSQLAPNVFPAPFRELLARPLLHDTKDEIAQPQVIDWHRDGQVPIPGKTMPHLTVVERDYTTLFDRFVSFGPSVREEGMEGHGLRWDIRDLYDRKCEEGSCHEWDGQRYPSLEQVEHAIEILLSFAPETNGEIAYRAFRAQEEKTGLRLADLAEESRSVRRTYADLVDQPRRLLTSPYWSGITNGGRPYAPYLINRERLVPWRTLTGRQHFYIDHEAYRAFGESLPTFKSKIGMEESFDLRNVTSPETGVLRLNCITPHGKWHIHTTYYDDLRMLTLSRGIEPFWLNEQDASRIDVADNDWVEVLNDNGVVVTRAVVSARIPIGLCIFYHASERTISVPISPARKYRAGGTNSMTRVRLKPVLLAGGYGQICYVFNAWGPPASDRDTYVIVRKLPGKPVID
jgi:nitrate reductase / nitrite oxidoreductase, alpha subunit